MGLLTVTGATLAALGVGLVVVRRRIVKKWIDMRLDETSLDGQTIVITGGNVGLGYEAALDCARRGAHVVMGCRNLNKGQEAAHSIQDAIAKDAPSPLVDCLELDLSQLASVRAFASQVKQKYKQIDAVVCNAGVWVPMEQEKKTPDGLEVHFGVNHLAHFELTRSLKDHLQNSRIIFVASSLAKSGQLDFDSQDFVKQGRTVSDGKKSFAPTAYCDSKLMNILCCKHLATLLPSSVTTYAVCPGFCRSSLSRNVDVPVLGRILMVPLMRLVQRTTVQGAQNIVFTVIADKGKLQSGAVYSDGVVDAELTDYVESLESEAAKQLWQVSEQIAREI